MNVMLEVSILFKVTWMEQASRKRRRTGGKKELSSLREKAQRRRWQKGRRTRNETKREIAESSKQKDRYVQGRYFVVGTKSKTSNVCDPTKV